MSFTILSVCTGNICRSPMSERLLAARTRSAPVEVVNVSAGTHGLTGYAMDPPSAQVLQELGGDPDGHSARRVRAADVEAADLVLTASTEHRATLAQLAPGAFRRIFTMREFGRLAAGLPAAPPADEQSLRQRVREIADQRGLAPVPAGRADDIADPFGAADEAARRIGLEVSAAVDLALAALGLKVPGPDAAAQR